MEQNVYEVHALLTFRDLPVCIRDTSISIIGLEEGIHLGYTKKKALSNAKEKKQRHQSADIKKRTSSRTSSCSVSSSSSSSSSSSPASSIANGVLSMSAFATTFVACASGSNPIGDVGFRLREEFSASATVGTRLAAAAAPEDSAVAAEERDLPPPSADVEVDLRLDLDDEWRIAGVSNDSRGRVSSVDVYRPMDGRWVTWCRPIVFPTSSLSLWNSFTLVSVAMLDHRPPRKPLLDGGSSMRGTGSRRKDAERSVSKKDSRTSSARTTMRN